MFLKILAFLLLLYFFAKVIGRIFLGSGKRKSAFFTFTTRNPQSSSSGKKNIDQIEEAEFEDITPKEKDKDNS